MNSIHRIAILGATSQIAKDLIVSFSSRIDKHLHLFARRPDVLRNWIASSGLIGTYQIDEFSEFGKQEFDAIINFVGVGNPAHALAMGSAIFDITLHFDDLVLGYLQKHPLCPYLFLSSGAVYGSNFKEPVTRDTKAVVTINKLESHEWYGVAKLHAESRHRSLSDLNIVDIRVFNYFSRTQDIEARFLISDILRAIRDKTVLETSPDDIVRDFLHPSDFYQLVSSILSARPANTSVDCYSLAPINKKQLLIAMQENFGLRYEIKENLITINATGIKSHYYSLNKKAEDFGYFPNITSLDGILQESRKILNNS